MCGVFVCVSREVLQGVSKDRRRVGWLVLVPVLAVVLLVILLLLFLLIVVVVLFLGEK